MATFIFRGIKAHIYGDKKNTFSVPLSLPLDSWMSLDFWHIIYYAFLNYTALFWWPQKLHLMFLEIRHAGIYKFQLLNFEPFLMNHKQAILIKEFLKDDLQSEYTVLNPLSRMRLILLFNAPESNIHIKGQ